MHILLLILKILGIVLLGILGILLFLLFLILFVPIRYSMEGKLEKEMQFECKGCVHWLFHLFSFRFSWLENKFSGTFRIFVIQMKHKKTTGKELEEEIGKNLEEDTEENIEETQAVEPAEITAFELSDSIEEKKTDIVDVSGQNSKKREASKQHSEVGKKNVFQKMSDVWDKIRKSFVKIGDSVRNLKTKFREGKALLTDEANKRVVKKAFGELNYLFRHFKFRKISTNLTFSLGDPAVTGQVLGALCLIPVLYQYDFHLYPDFESENIYAEGHFQFSGRIRMIHLLIVTVRMIADQDVRRLCKKFLRH